MPSEEETREYIEKMTAAADRALTYENDLERKNQALIREGEALMQARKINPESPFSKLLTRVKCIIGRIRNPSK